MHPDRILHAQGLGRGDFVALLFPRGAMATRQYFDRLRVAEATASPWLGDAEANLLGADLAARARTDRLDHLCQRFLGDGVEPHVLPLEDDEPGQSALMQRCLSAHRVQELIDVAQGQCQHYLSQHRFKGRSRRTSMLAVLSCSHLDLDFYKLATPDVQRILASDDGAIDAIVSRCADHGVLMPSQIVRSGRGLYVRWLFSHVLPAQAVTRWASVQARLHEIFAAFGSDGAALDASRVLRVVGSKNTRANATVRLLHYAPGLMFDDLARSVLHRERLSAADRVMTKQLRTQAARQIGSAEAMRRAEQWSAAKGGWCAGVFYDLRELIQMRGAAHNGRREQTLFLAANFGLRAGLLGVDDFLPQLAAWAQLMPRPHELLRELDGGCMNTLAQRARQGKDHLYRHKRTTIIDLLGIEPGELAQLPTLGRRSKPAAVARPKPSRNSNSRDQALRLAISGLSTAQIAGQLGLTERRVRSLLADLRSHKFA